MSDLIEFFDKKIEKLRDDGAQLPSHCFLGYNLYFYIRRLVYKQKENEHRIICPPDFVGQTAFGFSTGYGPITVKQVNADTSNFVLFGDQYAFDMHIATKILLKEPVLNF